MKKSTEEESTEKTGLKVLGYVNLACLDKKNRPKGSAKLYKTKGSAKCADTKYKKKVAKKLAEKKAVTNQLAALAALQKLANK